MRLHLLLHQAQLLQQAGWHGLYGLRGGDGKAVTPGRSSHQPGEPRRTQRTAVPHPGLRPGVRGARAAAVCSWGERDGLRRGEDGPRGARPGRRRARVPPAQPVGNRREQPGIRRTGERGRREPGPRGGGGRRAGRHEPQV